MIPKKIHILTRDVEILDAETPLTRAWVSINPHEKRTEYTDLSQAWHDASKEPEEGTQVVAIDHDGWSGSGLFNPMAMIKGVYLYGELIVDWYSVVRWAYLKDLLPKGGEE